MDPVSCFDPACARPATQRKLVGVDGHALELLWTCLEHALQCVRHGCARAGTEQRLLRVEGRLVAVSLCARHSG